MYAGGETKNDNHNMIRDRMEGETEKYKKQGVLYSARRRKKIVVNVQV